MIHINLLISFLDGSYFMGIGKLLFQFIPFFLQESFILSVLLQ